MALDLTCLQTRKAKLQVGALGGGGRAPGDDAGLAVHHPVVARLQQVAAGQRAQGHAGRRRIGQAAAASTRRFFFRDSTARAASVISGAMITSVKISAIAAAVSASSGRLRATMPPKALTGSQASAFRQASSSVSPTAHAAGVGVLDDGDGRRAELGDQLEGGVGVVEVVVAELLALELRGGGDARPRAGRLVHGGVEGGCLVRVLAVAQHLPPRAGDQRSGKVSPCSGEPAGDGGVVGAGARRPWRRGAGAAAVTAPPDWPMSSSTARVVAGIGDDGDEGVVLGGGADQRRPADVDILDAGRRRRRRRRPSPRRGRD
jgi:hypothetical protein